LNNRADITACASLGEIEALIAREKARGVPAARIVSPASRRAERRCTPAATRRAPAGILALSTYLVQPDKLPPEAAGAGFDHGAHARSRRRERAPHRHRSGGRRKCHQYRSAPRLVWRN
jgi:hypothetical protein